MVRQSMIELNGNTMLHKVDTHQNVSLTKSIQHDQNIAKFM